MGCECQAFEPLLSRAGVMEFVPPVLPAFVEKLLGHVPHVPRVVAPPAPRVAAAPEYDPRALCWCGCLAVDHVDGAWCTGCSCSYVELKPMEAHRG